MQEKIAFLFKRLVLNGIKQVSGEDKCHVKSQILNNIKQEILPLQIFTPKYLLNPPKNAVKSGHYVLPATP